MCSSDLENVHQATDLFVDTAAKEVYVADGYGNKRVVVFDSETGKFKRMWGAFGNAPPPTLAANPATPQPQTTPDGPQDFGLPHAIKVSRDGVVYVADRINQRVLALNSDFIGLQAQDLNLVTAVLVAFALLVPAYKRKLAKLWPARRSPAAIVTKEA